jgi:hypothetical protein
MGKLRKYKNINSYIKLIPISKITANYHVSNNSI